MKRPDFSTDPRTPPPAAENVAGAAKALAAVLAVLVMVGAVAVAATAVVVGCVWLIRAMVG
ncbi:MAG: hypothetical protein M3Y91_14900 [Actinomycetota bacterium]|nr:hypothetical protein [Actinomycetota bacterium]